MVLSIYALRYKINIYIIGHIGIYAYLCSSVSCVHIYIYTIAVCIHYIYIYMYFNIHMEGKLWKALVATSKRDAHGCSK